MIGADLTPADQRRRRTTVSVGLAIALVLVTLSSLVSGAADIGAADVWAMITSRIGAGSVDPLADSVLWSIRLPRIVGGAVVGAALAVAGCGLQGIFRNELADPQLLGLSAGAGLGALGAIAIAASASAVPWTAGAVGGAVAVALAIRYLALRIGDGARFVLAGLAVGLSLLAWLGALVVAWDDPRIPTFSFWVFGGLSGVTWGRLGPAVVAIAVGIWLIARPARGLDVLALGDAAARHLGVDSDRISVRVLTGAGFTTGGAVAVGGVIGLVGLVAPLAVRHVVGPGHRWLTPLAAATGAVALVALDTFGRTIAAPIEIAPGLLTAAVGGPLFALLAMRTRRWVT